MDMTLRKEEAARSRTSNHSPAWHGAELLAQARSGRHYRITNVVTVMARGRFAEIGLSEGDEIACVENRDGSMTLERPDAEHVSLQRDFAWFAYVRPIGVGPAAPWRAAHAPVEVGDEAPDFVIDTTEGVVRFPEWKRGDWAVLVSYPGDFTPVCTTELAALAALSSDFEKRGTKVMAIGVDPLALHHDWLHDIERLAG
jgi:hypothetical protein